MKNKKVFTSLTEDQIGLSKQDKICSEYRGKIVHCMVNLEYLTEQIILRYYFKKDQRKGLEFHYSVMSKESFSLSTKFNTLKYILDGYPEYTQKHEYFLPTFNELIQLRNNYAHRRFFKQGMSLLHNTIVNNKLAIRETTVSEAELNLFYGKYFVLHNDLLEILLLVETKT